MAPKGYRSFHDGPYHYCARCNDRTHISEMEWQRGLLLCLRKCYDTGTNPLIGQRQMEINKVLEQPTRELQPDPKLTNPDAGTSGDDLITF